MIQLADASMSHHHAITPLAGNGKGTIRFCGNQVAEGFTTGFSPTGHVICTTGGALAKLVHSV